MAEQTISVRIRWAWWFWPYIWGIEFFWRLGCEPDTEKLARMIGRAMRLKVGR